MSQTDLKLAELYKIVPELYLSLYIKDCNLSSRTKNALERNQIINVSELLSLSMNELIRIRNLGKNSCDEITRFIENLNEYKLPRISGETDTKERELKIIPYDVYIHKEDIINGDFSFKANIDENNTILMRKLNKYESAYNSIGTDLTSFAYYNSEKAKSFSNVLSGISIFLDEYLFKSRIINEVIKHIPYNRRKRKAFYYLDAYFSESSVSKKYLTYYKDTNANLDEVNIAALISNIDDYSVMYYFFKWCNYNVDQEINEFFSIVYAYKHSEKIIKMCSDNFSFNKISEELNISKQLAHKRFHLIIDKFKENRDFYSSIKSKIIADNFDDKKFTLQELISFFGVYAKDILFMINFTEHN